MVSSSALLPCCRQALGTLYLVSRLSNTQRLLLLSSMFFSYKGFKCVKIGKKWSRRAQLHKAAYICVLKNTSAVSQYSVQHEVRVFSYWAILLWFNPHVVEFFLLFKLFIIKTDKSFAIFVNSTLGQWNSWNFFCCQSPGNYHLQFESKLHIQDFLTLLNFSFFSLCC